MNQEISLNTRTHSLWSNHKNEGEIKSEILIGDNDLLSINFLKMAIEKSKSVAFVQVPDGQASGFLVSKDLLLTNNHVIPDVETASQSKITFNFEDDIHGNPEPTDVYSCEPNDFFWTNKNLDYSLVKINKNGFLPGNRWGFIPLIATKLNIEKNQSVNIIQHPRGRKKEIAIRSNSIVDVNSNKTIIKYTADTEKASSGAPGFTDQWNLIFLHHSAGDKVDGKYINNEGILISAIVNDLIYSLNNDGKGKRILFELGILGLEEMEYLPSKSSTKNNQKKFEFEVLPKFSE